MGGFEAIISQVASGRTLSSIARELGVPRETLSNLMYRDEERGEALRAARARAADALVDDALDIADAADPTAIAKAKLQVETRQWIASKYNRAVYGSEKAQVEINLGSLHLDALRNVREKAVIDVSPSESTR